jgi:ribonucleoside-diphosphate reductase alpha chain
MSETNGSAATAGAKSKLVFTRYFTKHGVHPFDEVTWVRRDASIKAPNGEKIFELKDCEVPDFWSQKATNIVAEKYFRRVNGKKETSAKDMILRVTKTVSDAGRAQGMFADLESASIFELELTHILLHQQYAFNSPVWFNIGVPYAKQQASACFIQLVEDSMESITDLMRKEILLFKGGSGTGTNFSNVRSSYETLTGGGYASGPVSFMEPLDSGAGVTKSGGTTRRAAKMAVLNVDHPDILVQKNGRPGFIYSKLEAEKIAQALIAAGYSPKFNDPTGAYSYTPFQNANNSVRVTDDFMKAVVDDKEWCTKEVLTGNIVHKYSARELWRKIAEAAWACGDPGLQFDTTTNRWHTCKASGRINASNPCSEYLFLDDTACNLGSINLLRFLTKKSDGTFGFDVEKFRKTVEVTITAMEILVGYSVYPSEAIAKNSIDFRPLGLGYANLGALLMALGLPYDSDEGRHVAAAITAILSGRAYAQSGRMAQSVGPFPKYKENEVSFTDVMTKHFHEAWNLDINGRFGELAVAAQEDWRTAVGYSQLDGYRNAQIAVIAPTGTISFLMDCDTTGIEPMLALVVTKTLVGGGEMRMPNEAVGPALKNLGYSDEEIARIAQLVQKSGQLEGIKEEHKKVFQTAIGDDPVSVDGHLRMMAAVQPFLSGGISKTVNMPESSTVEDVERAYMLSWELGLKCVAIYRDGCKKSQPVSSSHKKQKVDATAAAVVAVEATEPALKWGERKRLDDDRNALTHKFNVGGQEGYLTVGMYEDGTPGEVFLRVSHGGSTLNGLVDMAAMGLSIALQHGASLTTFVEKFKHMKFEPAGYTSNKNIRMAASIADYVARYLEERFLVKQYMKAPTEVTEQIETVKDEVKKTEAGFGGPPCSSCGDMTKRAGQCWVCINCGLSTGCG